MKMEARLEKSFKWRLIVLGFVEVAAAAVQGKKSSSRNMIHRLPANKTKDFQKRKAPTGDVLSLF